MHAFRRFALLLALALPASPALLAQSSTSSSSSATQDQGQSSGQAQQAPQETAAQISVQERIRQRRAQRRATAIHDAYDHRWETYIDSGYLRFTPGPSEQRVTFYAWESGLTRFSTERLGYTLDARAYYGTAYVGPNFTNDTRFAISQYDLLLGPVYRFYLQPRYSISGRVMAGGSFGNFEGDTGPFKNVCPPTSTTCLLYPDGPSYAASAAIIGEYNLTPTIAFKLAPEYFFTGFGSTSQASRGFTIGIVYRFAKQ
jgi:hypothetical protein